jgi:hypothetical protein
VWRFPSQPTSVVLFARFAISKSSTGPGLIRCQGIQYPKMKVDRTLQEVIGNWLAKLTLTTTTLATPPARIKLSFLPGRAPKRMDGTTASEGQPSTGARPFPAFPEKCSGNGS